MLIINPKGVWVRNTGFFAFTNPDTGERVPHGMPVRVTDSDWFKTQPVFEYIDDPLAEPKSDPVPEPVAPPPDPKPDPVKK